MIPSKSWIGNTQFRYLDFRFRCLSVISIELTFNIKNGGNDRSILYREIFGNNKIIIED